MATINSVIQSAQKLRPDSFTDEQKTSWISELDGKILRETMHRNEKLSYRFPNDASKELLVKEPYDNIYVLYIIAMADFFSCELSSYGASAQMFERAYEEFRKNYIRNHMPPQTKITV